jgi:maltooligosyltrehalose trehalohydrolase
VHVALTGEVTGYYADFSSLSALAKTAAQGFFHDGSYSSFRGRNHGFPIPPEVPTWRLVTFAQDHDQIGNRAAGDRLSATLSYGRLAAGAVLNLTSPFTPMLFMGEEWGASTPWQFFTSHPEEWLGEATAKGRVEEFEKMGWDESLVPDPQSLSTFEDSKLVWDEASAGDHARLLALYRDLAALRRARPELTDPAFASVAASYSDEEGWFRLERGTVTVLVNLGAADTAIEVADGDALLLATDASSVTLADGTLTVGPDAAAIVGPAPA